MHTPRRTLVALLGSMLLLGAARGGRAQGGDSETAAVAATVRRFHAALAAGDAAAAAALLAPDAVVMEGGVREGRQAYIDHHLPEDIAFARAVPSRVGAVEVTVAGDVAWAASTSVTQGSFQGKPVNLAGAELMVLSRAPGGWLIRAIHWSSHKAR